MSAAAVCIVLLLDASRSLTAEQWAGTVEAHARALESPRVAQVAEAEGVAVAAAAFAEDVHDLAPWRVLRSGADARAFAAEMRATVSLRHAWGISGTATGEAVFRALAMLDEAPPCERRVIDLVTDGDANAGRMPADARDEAEASGVQINAVVLRTQFPDAAEWAREELVTAGGFVLEATTWDAWTRAIERKLVMEVAGR